MRGGVTIRSLRKTQAKRLCLLLALCFGAALTAALSGATNGFSSVSRPNLLRVGFSSATFTKVNENDVMAALKVWLHMLAKERGIPTDPQPRLLNGLQAIRESVRGNFVDAVALNTDEYWKIQDTMDRRLCIVGLNEGRPTEEYILLTHQQNGIRRIADLRGHSLVFFQSPRMSLASVWMDTVLVQGGFRRTVEFCQVTHAIKLQDAVLPLFFRKIDACVVTRRAFNTMNELNPQISQQLRVIASSPEVVPALFAFRQNYNDPIREKIISQLEKIVSTPAGAQFLTLFQAGSLKALPTSCLGSAFDLLSRHKRLCGQTKTVKTGGVGTMTRK
ncbi:MAG: phosphate/phosphite/phosphonate ABC transporter substrate-binding protein [Syntrophaceae bacterium]|nr:phosphate/phosphite/phosphonate ABC transporter substrate-binding protein [Syntrophaceae bacterium]